LRSLYDIVALAGGAKETHKILHKQSPRRMVIISVNAATDPGPEMDKSNKLPSLEETVAAVTDVQINRYNAATLRLMERSLDRWAKEVSTPERPVTPYFIHVSFKDAQDPTWRLFFNQVPTSFSLTDEQVDRLILAGHKLLGNDAGLTPEPMPLPELAPEPLPESEPMDMPMDIDMCGFD
jgi:NTE family protein